MIEMSHIEVPAEFVRHFPKLKGYKISLYQRDHKHTPFIVCATTPEGEPMLEAGFEAYTEVSNQEQLLMSVFGRLQKVLMVL